LVQETGIAFPSARGESRSFGGLASPAVKAMAKTIRQILAIRIYIIF
jgi:hypothetical protein